MLKEFVITPDVLLSARQNPELFLAYFYHFYTCIKQTGIIGDLDNGAEFDRTIKIIEQEKPDLAIKLREYLKTLKFNKRRIIERPPVAENFPQTDQNWVDLADRSYTDVDFYALIITQEVRQQTGKTNDRLCIPFLPDCCNNQKWIDFENIRNKKIHKNLQDYEECLTPFLRYATCVHLFDPYIDLDVDRYKRTIKLVARLLGRKGNRKDPGTIHLHLATKKNYNNRIRGGKNKLKCKAMEDWTIFLNEVFLETGHRFIIRIWQQFIDDRPHDRWIFTDQGSINTPYGVDCEENGGSETTWHFEDDHIHDDRIECFIPSPGRHKKLYHLDDTDEWTVPYD